MKDVTVYMRSLHQNSKKGKKGERKLLSKKSSLLHRVQTKRIYQLMRQQKYMMEK
jgi:hypothetical protein